MNRKKKKINKKIRKFNQSRFKIDKIYKTWISIYTNVQNDFRRENDRSFVEKSRRGRRRPDEKRRAERKIEEGRGGADGGERGRRR